MSYNDSNKPSANNSKGLFVTFVDREINTKFCTSYSKNGLLGTLKQIPRVEEHEENIEKLLDVST